LAGGNLPNTNPDSNLALLTLETNLLGGNISKQTHDTISAQIDAGAARGVQQKPENKPASRKPGEPVRSSEVSTMAGLLLGSPEFQRR
jgi:hypothetical protein